MSPEQGEHLPPKILQDKLKLVFFVCIPTQDGVYRQLGDSAITELPKFYENTQSVEKFREGVQQTFDVMSQTGSFERLASEWEFLTPQMNVSQHAIDFVESILDVIAFFGEDEQRMKDKPDSLYHALGLYKEDDLPEGPFASDKSSLAEVEKRLLNCKKEQRNYIARRYEEDRQKSDDTHTPILGLENVAKKLAEKDAEVHAWEEEYQRRYPTTS